MQKETVQAPVSLVAPKAVINYIHGGPVDDRHSSKRQKWRLLCAASAREHINSVQHNFLEESVHFINDTVTLPLVGANQVLQPHEDALILILEVGGFEVRRVLVDPSNSTDLFQMSAYKQMNYLPSTLENLECLLLGFNGATTTFLGDVVLPIQASPVTLNV